MAPLYLILVLVVQSSLIYANEEAESIETVESLTESAESITDLDEDQKDWSDSFTSDSLFPTSSAIMMTEAIDSDKSDEDQLEDIKEVAEKITQAIQKEMLSLLTYALNTGDIEEDDNDNNVRARRSAESPMDSTRLVMRLLKHIKSNNEFQNTAIDKMMTAQEIADKFGIEFNPDPEILSDLAVAAIEHAKELSSMLNDASDLQNNTTEKFCTITSNTEESLEIPSENSTYYVYALYYPDEDINSQTTHEYMSQPVNHAHYYNYPYDSQTKSSSSSHYHSQPMSQKLSFYDTISYTPEYYSSSCSMEPTASYTLPMELLDPEPELVAEEYEETMSNKVVVERGDEPGSAMVNHITTYSISEKSHFKTPQIEKLPQQIQYSFYLI